MKLPQSIDTHGRITPQHQWVIVRDAEGRLVSTLVNNQNGTVQNYTVLHFERGDRISFRLHPSIASGGTIALGDTVATVHSNRIEQQFVRLQGQLATAQSSLELTLSGRKEAIVEEAQQHLLQARTQADYQEKKVARLRALYSSEIATAEELEVEENTQALYQIEVDIAQARLLAAQTGARQPEVELIQTRIESLQREIDILAKRLGNLAVIAPLAGVVSGAPGADTLLVVQDHSAYLALVPIPWKDRAAVSLQQTVELQPENAAAPLLGHIVRLDHTVRYLDRTQVLMALVSLPSTPGLNPGLIVPCRLSRPPLTPLELLAQTFAY